MEAKKIELFRSTASQQSLGVSHLDIYNKVINIFSLKQLHRGSILDVGAGLGDFIKLLKERTTHSFFAVDLMFSDIPGVEWFVQDLNKNLQFQDEKFDVLTCLEVLEHVENPRKLVREMARVLKPGGHMILSTPNNESWRSILAYIFRGHFVAFENSSYPAHITAMNKIDLYRMCDESGLMNIEFYYTDKGCLPKWTSQSWQSVSANFLKGMRYSDNIICVAQKSFLKSV